MRTLGVLWRGPLDSCNYHCAYCPFAKRQPLPGVMAADRQALARFVSWVESATARSFEILFTPYGEALVQPWYREALVRLSRMEHVRSAAIQTNGSPPMAFLDMADRRRIALWVSWHPGEIARPTFVAKMVALHQAGTRLSVGAVAVPAHLEEIEALRRDLLPAIPMWINAQRPGVSYEAAALARWSRIDPDFELEARAHRTRGLPCRTGDEVISVDGAGNIRRCHFVDEILGNLYSDDLESMLRPRPCPRMRCNCWIGYAHLAHLGLRDAFDEGNFLVRLRRAGA